MPEPSHSRIRRDFTGIEGKFLSGQGYSIHKGMEAEHLVSLKYGECKGDAA